ncbi:MAG: hypothetical protein Q4G45_10925 [Actinomycetia bacterium]|nr:hypothetical protein [Actinomycetes bacterium]
MTSPTRSAQLSRNFRVAQFVAGAGGAVGIVCFPFAPWVGRLGIAALMVSAAVALYFIWREFQTAKQAYHDRLMVMHERYHDELVDQRAGYELVTSLLRTRNVQLAGDLADTRADLVEARQELAGQQQLVSTLRGGAAALTAERDELLARLTQPVEEDLEPEVVPEVSDTEVAHAAEVLTLPRRVRRDSDDRLEAEVWGTEEMPSVAALVMADRDDQAQGGTPLYRKQA